MADVKETDNRVRETLLNLGPREKYERHKAKANYIFYRGKAKNLEEATKIAKGCKDKTYLGQNWLVNDKLDYTPTQLISNKVKVNIDKQARWMFGRKPDILIIPDVLNDETKEQCDNLRKYLENILDYKFWNETKKAFLLSTIKARVAARVVAIPELNKIKIRYDDIDNISYKESDGELIEIKYFAEDEGNVLKDSQDDKIYYIYKYYYNLKTEKEIIDNKEVERKVYTPYFSKLTYKGNDLDNPIKEEAEETYNQNNHEIGFDTNSLPCWIIKNNPTINNRYGQSDVEDIKDLQMERNKKLSDNQDALKFQMFGAVSVIDGSEDTVNSMVIAPGAKFAIKTADEAANQGKQASVDIKEYSMSSNSAVQDDLQILDDDMRDLMNIPKIKDLTNVSSAKAMRYLYNDLIDSCEGKWSDWTPYLIELIKYIIDISPEFNLRGWDPIFLSMWDNITIKFKHNYPIPQDESDDKSTAMDEVAAGVRSKKSYIREFSKNEDADKSYQEILEEKATESNISFGIARNEDGGEDGNKKGTLLKGIKE